MERSNQIKLLGMILAVCVALAACAGLIQNNNGGVPETLEISGKIESIGSDSLVVDGQTVKIPPGLTLPDTTREGDVATLQVEQGADGSLTLVDISVEDAQTPEATDTVEPQDTPEATDTVEPQDTSEATDTVEPQDTPEATDTVEPQDTPEATDTVEPQETPEATDSGGGSDSGGGGGGDDSGGGGGGGSGGGGGDG